MRIAILSSNLLPLPPAPTTLPPGFAGAAERVMWEVTEGMVGRGHDVTLFASGDSQTSAKLVSVTERASVFDPNIGAENHIAFEHLLISKCYTLAKRANFDIIHSLFDTRSAYYAGLVDTPTVSTIHSPLTGHKKMILEKIPDTQWYVSISNAQRKGLPSLRYAETIYHGIAVGDAQMGDGAGGFMILVGRISPEKGMKEAAAIARKTRRPLAIYGSAEPKEEAYLGELRMFVDQNTVTLYGMVDRATLWRQYAQAKVFLFPLQWEEPFGLVMIESMVCGTPVIAYARGSVPEVVSDGQTGFIVNQSDADKRGDWVIKQSGEAGIMEAIERIFAMPLNEYQAMRNACRKRVETLFTVETMVGEYEKLYQKIISMPRVG